MEVELDIFSGNPNPQWVLSDADAEVFLRRISVLPQVPAREFSGNLGYRGFIVQMMRRSEGCLVRIQSGTVRLSQGRTTVYYSDSGRELERWLLKSGKPFLKHELFVLVEDELTK